MFDFLMDRFTVGIVRNLQFSNVGKHLGIPIFTKVTVNKLFIAELRIYQFPSRQLLIQSNRKNIK